MRVSALQALKVAVLGSTSQPLARRLREIYVALQRGSVTDTLRLIDRLWRSSPEAAGMLAPIYGRLLLLEDRDPDAALRVLSRVESPDADVAALTARVYFLLRRSEDARGCLDAALKTYSVAPRGLLCQEASAALCSDRLQAVGWIGLGSNLEFVGELAEGYSADSLCIHLGKAVLERSVQVVMRDGRVRFSVPAPIGMASEMLSASSCGVPLLGSGHRFPLEFGLDGRIDGHGRTLSGWSRLGWLPTEPLQLRVEDEYKSVALAKSRGVPLPGYRWPFDVDLRGAGVRGNRLNVLARLPDRRWAPLPDAPFLLPRALRVQTNRTARLPRWRKEYRALKSVRLGRDRSVEIVIPVYRGTHETLACIHSVLATVGEHARVVVVDDATVEAPLATALDDLSVTGRIILLRNESNLGFVQSVNRVLALNSGRDIVLLNSDTLVFDDWLRRLSAAAYSDPHVGTVTPFTNDGSIASYPHSFGGAIDTDEAAVLDKLAARTNEGISAEIPVGVGFCLYIKHDCLKEVGELDAATFGVGYGEESDFCLRARGHGWSHRIAADVFVYHAGGGSFGPRRAALLDRSQRLLNLRYPGYDRYIAEFLTQDRLLPLRRKLDERRLAAFEGRFVLIVTLALEGGVERFVSERKQRIRAEGLCPLVLKPIRFGGERGCELSTDTVNVPNLRYIFPGNSGEFNELLALLRLDRVEIQHFLDHDPAVIDAVCALGVPYDVMIHDYAWICPRITMIGGSGRYCGEPDVSACQSCVRKHGSRLPKALSVAALRARSEVWLTRARSVSAPSSDTAARFRRYFPSLDIIVTPHSKAPSPSLPSMLSGPRGGRRSDRLRVGLIGAIGAHKGYRVLLECARDAAARRLPLEFVVIGYTENDRPLLRTGKVEVTGRYVDAEVSHLLWREQPDVVFLPSVWPETWCYALDHVLSACLPAVAFDIGAVAERLRMLGGHMLLPLDLAAAQINGRLLEFATSGNPARYFQTSRPDSSAVTRLRKKTGTTSMKPSGNDLQHDEGLSASLQVLPLLPGLYLFSVKSATPTADRGRGSLRLPAMHVGLGPGVPSEHVEFVAGPGTEGAWLFARGDVLVAKVSDPGATLILTSVRAPNGEVLSIEVERLESRSHTSQMPAVADKSVNHPATAARASDSGFPVAMISNPASNVAQDGFVPLQIKTHIRSRGDMNFADAPWAGRVAPGLWLESFSVQPLKNLSARDIEYKGLTGTGFETPWLSDDQNCGTKGMSVPLVGFAVRLRPSAETALYDCEYSGYFQSGTVIGPLRNGAPCRSTVANDPLEGLQIRFVRRVEVVAGVASKTRESAKAVKRGRSEGAAGKADSGLRSPPRP
jgi:GT2 family glycosyltransferase